MHSKIYKILKFIALVVLPAVTVFVGVILETLTVKSSGVVVTIMTAFDTMIGTIIHKFESNNYLGADENEEGN